MLIDDPQPAAIGGHDERIAHLSQRTQVPERRPRERDEGAIRAWIARNWPAIKKK